MEGFGASSHLHTSRILRLSEDLPIIVEIVDATENIERVMHMFDEMVGDGLMTLEAAHVVTYRGTVRGHASSAVEGRLSMLAQQAQALADLEGDQPEARSSFEESVQLLTISGATDEQIVRASGLTEDELRRVLSEHDQ